MDSSTLLNTISQNLSIPRDSNESIQDWKKRLIYSAVGRMSLASLWDNEEPVESEPDKGISITRYKALMMQRIEAFYQVLGMKGYLDSISADHIADEIYEIYSVAGFFYHEPHWISPSISRSAGYGDLCFIRDCNPAAKFAMSGLGYYDEPHDSLDIDELCDMFHLPHRPYVEWLQSYLKTCRWEPVELPQDTEYLRMKPPFTKGYWVRTMSVPENAITLCRYGFTGQKIYYLVRKNTPAVLGSQLPEWIAGMKGRTLSYLPGEYYRVALALLMAEGTLPPVHAQESDHLVTVELPYLLPTEEEALFKLYSWPVSLEDDQNSLFIRKMDIKVFNCFKMLLQFYGFHF